MKFDSQGRLMVAGETGSPSGTTGGGLTDAELRAAAVPVSATALPLPTGAATAAHQGAAA